MIKIFGEVSLLSIISEYLPKVTIEAPEKHLISSPIDKNSREKILKLLESKGYIKNVKKEKKVKDDFIENFDTGVKIKIKTITGKNEDEEEYHA